MTIDINTPALLFPTISLLLLAYTNRFLSLAALIRELHAKYKAGRDPIILAQLANLRRRIHLIRDMQGIGVASLLLCTMCMGLLFGGLLRAGEVVFGLSLVLMITSLVFSLVEIRISIRALELHLSDLENEGAPK